MTEWFVIDTRSNRIINCITTSKPGAPDLSMFQAPEFLRADNNPPLWMLEKYQFWNERP